MSADARCERTRIEISARLDGEVDGANALALDRHLETCADCRAYAASLHELRRSLRLQPIPDPPDIADAVMARLPGETRARERRELVGLRLRIGAVAAGIAALILASTVLPFDRAPGGTAVAEEIEREVTMAAESLDTYHARYLITERGWHPRVDVRSFAAEIWFDAPESFRLRLRDLTEYPSAAWPRNDVDLVSSPDAWWIREPYSCPTEALPACAFGSGVEQRSIVDRQPFDGTSDAPTDIAVPLESIARSEGVRVLGRARIDGRAAHHVALTYGQAFPLVSALQAGGSWAPLAPLDRVDVWLDGETWFPLAFQVRDASGSVVLDVEADLVEQPSSLPASLFDAPRRGVVRDGGFTGHITGAARFAPTYTAGLDPYRSGTIESGPEIMTFARGMTWLKVLVVGGPIPLSTQLEAEVVALGEGGRALYLPADGIFERRIELGAAAPHVQIESNLPRAELLKVAASIPIPARVPDEIPVQDGVLERIGAAEAGRLPFVQRPVYLPPGYRPTGTFLRTGVRPALIERFALPESEFGGYGIRIDQTPSVTELPPSSEDLVGVRIGEARGRWSADRGRLEWIDGGVYRAITAPAFDLPSVLAIAREMR